MTQRQSDCTIIMYHYVRNGEVGKFNGLNVREKKEFIGQLDYIESHYTVCSGRSIVDAFLYGHALPKNACLLTFDDGFSDHYFTVFPELQRRGLKAVFFPPGQAIMERIVADTHKVQFILAGVEDKSNLLSEIWRLLTLYRDEYNIPGNDELFLLCSNMSHPYDDKLTTVIKRLLQDMLPEAVRKKLLRTLFCRYVSDDEQGFANKLYMTKGQLKTLINSKMEIGGHGYRHYRLAGLNRRQQQFELARTHEFLQELYDNKAKNWIMAYPYGSYNDDTISLLKQYGCAAAVTIERDSRNSVNSPWCLARMDTNDLPLAMTG